MPIWSLGIGEQGVLATTTVRATSQICILSEQKEYLCTLCTCIFIFVYFVSKTTTWNGQIWGFRENVNAWRYNFIFSLKWAISELLFVSVSKWVLVLNYCKGNEFDLHKNTQLISIWMVVHQDSLWNWGMQQLGNGLLSVVHTSFFLEGLQQRYPVKMLGIFAKRLQ